MSPWSLLAEDLRAVLASLRLRVQELWRRNGSGQLPLPSLWPRALASFFWPLLLAALILFFAIGVRTWSGRLARPVAVVPLTPPPPTLPVPLTVADAPDRDKGEASGPGPRAPQPVPAATPASGGLSEPGAAAAPPVLRLDPLVKILAAGDGPPLLAAARPQPERSRLVLGLTAAFLALPAAERQRQADRWLEQASGLGYESLVLKDERGQVLGRQARVGTGMILLANG